MALARLCGLIGQYNPDKALADSAALQSVFTGSYSIAGASSLYRYICYPDSMGDALFFRDGITQQQIGMATSADNAAYSHTANGFSYALVSVTNVNSVTTNYRVYRTRQAFSGTLVMVVT